MAAADEVDPDAMLFWIAKTCEHARINAGRGQVHIAATFPGGLSQQTITRFEQAKAWPDYPDEMVKAYADDLDIEPTELWSAALDQWKAYLAEDNADVKKRIVDAVEEAGRRRRERRRGSGESKRGRQRRAQDG